MTARPEQSVLCPDGHRRILGADAARAVGRFLPGGPAGYMSKLGGPLRRSRAEAETDYIHQLAGRCSANAAADRRAPGPRTSGGNPVKETGHCAA